jgi:serine/threonine protein kinase
LALNHPSIVAVYDITRADGLDFSVMEYVDGIALDALIPRAGIRTSALLKTSVQTVRAQAAISGSRLYCLVIVIWPLLNGP